MGALAVLVILGVLTLAVWVAYRTGFNDGLEEGKIYGYWRALREPTPDR